MIHRILVFLSVLCAGLALPGATTDDCTVRCKIDLSDVAADEPLYEVGPVRLALRMAGRTKELKQYDICSGTYPNFSLPNGSCPVIEAYIFIRYS